MGNYWIAVDDISKLAKLVNSLKEYEYDVEKVISEFSNLEGLRLQHQHLKETVPFLKTRKKSSNENVLHLKKKDR
jgi:hypothetical protein